MTLLALAVVALIAAAVHQHGAVTAKAVADRAEPAPQAPRVAPVPPAPAPDLVLGLPLRADLPSAVAHLLAAADRHGVAVLSFAASDRPADARHLGWTEWVVSLRGRYEPVRKLLQDMSQAEPVLVLHALSLRARGVEGDLEVEQRWRLPVRSAEAGR